MPEPPGAPPAAAKVERLLIVSIDGLRPDVALRANMPNMRALMRRGTFTFWATTTETAVTLPSHVSMLTGVTPERHRIWWDIDPGPDDQQRPAFPTLFELARNNGLTAGMAVGKPKLGVLAGGKPLSWSFVPELYANDDQVAREAARIIADHRPQVMFVHLPDTDAAGHGSGWGSPEQIKTVENADRCLGVVLGALNTAGLLRTTVVIVTADHGGMGHSHYGNDPRSRHIPWIIAGPGIRQNLDLASIYSVRVRTEDTFATACAVLGLPLDRNIDGRPVTAAMVNPPAGLPPAWDVPAWDQPAPDPDPPQPDMQNPLEPQTPEPPEPDVQNPPEHDAARAGGRN